MTHDNIKRFDKGKNNLDDLIPGLPFSSLFTGGDPNSKHCRRRKARTVFSDQQLNGLEKRFEAQRYLSTPERVELANALNLSETQVNAGKRWETNSYNNAKLSNLFCLK